MIVSLLSSNAEENTILVDTHTHTIEENEQKKQMDKR